MKTLLLLLIPFMGFSQIPDDRISVGSETRNGLQAYKIQYIGNWVINSRGCNCSYSKNTGDKIIIDFVGTSIAVYGEALDTHGKVAIYLDDIQYPIMDQYKPYILSDHIQLEITNLTYGNHRLEMIVTGEKHIRATNNYFVFRGAQVKNERISDKAKVIYNGPSEPCVSDTVIIEKPIIKTVYDTIIKQPQIFIQADSLKYLINGMD